MIADSNNSNQNRNIYIVGFMGVGKSTVGRRLAYRLKMDFIDSDRAIERVTGKTVAEIFSEDAGENHFRQLEREFIESGHPASGCVVACGGGLPVAEGIMELLKSQGVVIALFAKTETILERTDRRQSRPLLEVDNKEERISNLLAVREDIYQKADHLIFSGGRRIEDVVSDIIRIYKSETKSVSGQNHKYSQK